MKIVPALTVLSSVKQVAIAFSQTPLNQLPFSQPPAPLILGALILITQISVQGSAHAQIIPDGTLSTNVSSSDGQNFTIDNGNVCCTQVGDRTGNNLFHSFLEFSVPSNGSAVFNNANDIENIFSRVTGSNVSNIDGLIQTNGMANLFLLNPNGVIFGPNARLNVAGSFTASTANRFTFADGSEFSSTSPTAPLLTIRTPLGLQLNAQPQGDIESFGHLQTGQDITLHGQNLYLEGRVVAGQNLTLQAQDTVTLRDTQATPFVARSGADLTIQGNQGIDILTLQHPGQTPFVSGRDLTLISDGAISADTHFSSGGNLHFLNLASDPGGAYAKHKVVQIATEKGRDNGPVLKTKVS